jgi:hypothetical protein
MEISWKFNDITTYICGIFVGYEWDINGILIGYQQVHHLGCS